MMPPAPRAIVLPEGIPAESLLAVLRRLGWEAADILRAYARGEQPPFGHPAALAVDHGSEGPVSAADLAVNRQLVEGLEGAFPAAPWTVLSEESAKEQLRSAAPLGAEWLWLLDPLDGTKDFLQGTGHYAVHLALAHRGALVLGVVLVPEAGELWFGWLPEDGSPPAAWREDRAGRRYAPALSERREPRELVLVTSRNHRDDRLRQLLEALAPARSLEVGSVGCKVATILRGESDGYLSLSGRTAPKHWDMAAPEAVLRAAGGGFSHADGHALRYDNADGLQAGCLVASHGPCHGDLCDRALAALAMIDPGFAV